MSAKSIRVLYNASAVPPRPAGAGVYTLELGAAMAAVPGVELEVLAPAQYGFGAWVSTPRNLVRRVGWEEFQLHRLGALRQSDVYHGAHFFTPRTHIPTVATVHDLTFFRIPGRYGAAHRHYYRHLARTAIRADRIIVPSSAVAGDCVRFLGYPREHIRVVAEAPRAGLAPVDDASIDEFRSRSNITGPYLVCLGTAERGKRTVDAIRAMPQVLGSHPDAQLLLAGGTGPLSSALRREALRIGVAGQVRFLGYVPDADLPSLLSGATALVFPSLYEGFGLPPLEAMACGTPVITSDSPAMSEVLRGAAIFVPLRDPAAIAEAVTKLLATPTERAARSRAAIEFASGFTWAKAATETAGVYRELVR